METLEPRDQRSALAQQRLDRLIDALGPRNRRVMKRCFMTGKQCIFSSHVAEGATRPITDCDLNVFIVMPFAPNLEIFYQWSLKPLLTRGYRLAESAVQRADEVREIGYIVCEKICRKIQESDLVMADVSLNSPNVFYEIGLAAGLERPLALMRNHGSHQGVLSDICIRQSLNLSVPQSTPDPILDYPGVDALGLKVDAHWIDKYVRRPSLHQSPDRRLEVSILRVERAGDARRSGAVKGDRPDIEFDFTDVLKGAVGVAMTEIRADANRLDFRNEPWVGVVREIADDEWTAFSKPELVTVNGQGGFDRVARDIESSFCTVIDVSDNDPVAYFWLGYCHARALNAIPVSHMRSVDESSAATTLAFDIRALWYAGYDRENPAGFKTKIREIMEHLLARDLPDRQKRAFWDRFRPDRKLKVFTAAVHYPDLNREVVGDWDVRAVSELFSYLPSVREAMTIELVTPMYSPEEACRRNKASPRPADSPQAFIEQYRESIKNQLQNADAIVIASPDVNPVTEYLLHRIYRVREPARPFESADVPRFQGYIVVKQERPRDGGPASAQQATVFPRLFYRTEEGEESLRGFGHHFAPHAIEKWLYEYLSQDECDRVFYLLGHLVVAQDGDRGLFVLLNGVSGPATFALAQLLTGGGLHGSPRMNADSERMLRQINSVLDEPGCVGVEALIKVKIAPAEDLENQTYLDSRRVESWEFLLDHEPRPLPR